MMDTYHIVLGVRFACAGEVSLSHIQKSKMSKVTENHIGIWKNEKLETGYLKSEFHHT